MIALLPWMWSRMWSWERSRAQAAQEGTLFRWLRRLLWGWIGIALALAPLQGVQAAAQPYRSAELQGMISGPDAYHFYGLEAIQPGGVVALTLEFAVDGRSSARDGESVNFAVLTEEGLVRFLAGADLLEAAVTAGSPPLFDPADNRRTALAGGSSLSANGNSKNGSPGMTVVVFSTLQEPAHYTLRVQGGLLRDDAGQSLGPGSGEAGSIAGLDPASPFHSLVPKERGLPGVQQSAPVEARRVSGALPPDPGRHYLRLVPDATTGEVTLTLLTTERRPANQASPVNFWLLTQEGVRHLVQGGLIQELNLASGAPVASVAGATMLRAQLATAASVPYVVVVENRSGRAVNYTLTVEGARLVDEQGQTNEAKAAALEQQVLALSGR